jgi:hypothetical protein
MAQLTLAKLLAITAILAGEVRKFLSPTMSFSLLLAQFDWFG